MVIFHSYVKLPEGNSTETPCHRMPPAELYAIGIQENVLWLQVPVDDVKPGARRRRHIFDVSPLDIPYITFGFHESSALTC